MGDGVLACYKHIKIEDVKHVSGGGYMRLFIYSTIFASAMLLLIGYLLDFRDGVSESQFNQVLNIELDQIIEVL